MSNMFSNPGARMSIDSVSPTSTPTPTRHEFPFHRQGSVASQRRESRTGSIHSIGGALDSGSSSWTQSVPETGQNAISTLLQPPIVRTGLLPHTSAPASSAHKPPTAKDIPPVTLTNITRVEASEFKPYLSQVGRLYETLQRIKESDDDAGGQAGRRPSRLDEPADDGHLRPKSRSGSRPGSRPGMPQRTSSSSVPSVSPLEPPALRRKSSAGLSRRSAQGPPPLSTVPNVYFDDDFHLENPRIFDIVSERSEVVRQAPGSAEEKSLANGSASAVPRKALATNAILQEKLSWYMDTIEMHLISSISTASTTFFTALGSLRELHAEAADSVDKIKALRGELESLDQEIAVSGLDIVQKRRRRENLQRLNDVVLQLKAIVGAVAACESQVDAGESEKALATMRYLEKLIAGEEDALREQRDSRLPKQLQDLREAVALQGVNSDMTTLRFRVGKTYESQFISVLLEDLRRHIDTVKSQEVLLRWSSAALRSRGHSREPSAFPAYLSATDGLRSRLMPLLVGLHRAKHISVAISTYREVVLREVRNLVRRPLPSSNEDDNESMMSASTVGGKQLTQQEKSSILARNLRALEPEDAEELFKKIYVSVTETLRRLTTQVKVLFDVSSSIGRDSEPSSGPPKSPTPAESSVQDGTNREIQEDIHLTMDMANLLGQAVDVTQDKIVKILRVRIEQSSHLSLVWFLRYFTLNLYFANECEAISGRSGTSLKTVVNSQIKEFIQQHGDKAKQELAQGMESDQWSAKDFSEKDSVLLARVLECSTKDDPAWEEGKKIWTAYSETSTALNGRPRSASNSNAKEKTRSAVVESETFILPNSAMLCLEGMSSFLHLISSIPSVAPDVATSLVSYLHLFNSRCTQLILGTGATRSAGLKNITTGHLALAAQSLAFISTLIPHVREFVRRHAGAGPSVNSTGVAGLMGEFDKVRRVYQEHQNSIYDKLVEIMSGRAAAHAKSIKRIDWGKTTGPAVNVYMETLVKETEKLHRALAKYLQEGTVRLIMASVFDSYKSQLGAALQGLEPDTEMGVQRMQSDVDYFISRLGTLAGFGDAGEQLQGIVKTKRAAVAKADATGEGDPGAGDDGAKEDGAKGEQTAAGESNPTASNEGGK